MKRIVTFFLLLSLSFPVGAITAKEIKGKVSSGKKGIAGVVVTDGFYCVTTDGQGSYSFTCHPDAKFIYISTPPGYLPERIQGTIPRFYKEIVPDITTYNFELKPNPKDDRNHILIAQADVQMSDENDLELYKKLLPDGVDFIRTHKDMDIVGVDCGDIAGDNHGIIPGYLDAVSVLDIPIYRAIGNHDMDYHGRSHETSTRTFEGYFGPTYYSFNKGKAHYVVLNNTFFMGREYFYMGYIDENTFRWLEQDLSYVTPGSPVFVILHIPTQLQSERVPFVYNSREVASNTINAQGLYQLLAPFHTHIISGHTHYNRKVVHHENLYEHVTAAVCGTWWQGDVCLDGTPQGFGVYEVKDDKVSWYYKSFHHPREYQFKCYRPGIYKEYPNDLIVNVWNWDPDWKVEWYENDQYQGEMKQFSSIDADVMTMCSRELKYKWISPMETDHLFIATPQDVSAPIRVKVTDRFGHVYEEDL